MNCQHAKGFAMMMKFASGLSFAVMLCLVPAACAGPARYEPASGQGPLVLMISGKTGTTLYGEFAQRLADAGYRVVLTDGNDYPLDQPEICRLKIRQLLADNIRNPSEKTAVIGYSLGGSVAFSCATAMPEHIAGVIAYYPATKLIADPEACVDNLRVPIVILQGEEDHYFDCCRVEVIRTLQQRALERGRNMELIVYPNAGHGFNLGPMRNRDLDRDAWQKTSEALKRFLP